MIRPQNAILDVVCECGHKGFLCCNPPVGPNAQWCWWLKGFKGETIFTDDSVGHWRPPSDLLVRLRPECPYCFRSNAVYVQLGNRRLRDLERPIADDLRELEAVVRKMDVGSPDLCRLQDAANMILKVNGKASSLSSRFSDDGTQLKILYLGQVNQRVSIKDGLYLVRMSHLGEVAETLYENMELIAWQAGGEERPSVVDALVESNFRSGRPNPVAIPATELFKHRNRGFVWTEHILRRAAES